MKWSLDSSFFIIFVYNLKIEEGMSKNFKIKIFEKFSSHTSKKEAEKFLLKKTLLHDVAQLCVDNKKE